MLSRLFARRYLFSRNSRSVINIISGVSIVAIAVPVGAMIILLSVFNGFETIIRQMRSAYDADLTITPVRGTSFATAELPKERIAAVGGVEALSYVIEQGALLSYGENRMTAMLRGVDEEYADAMPVEETVFAGRFEVQLGEDIDKIVLGQGLAYTLGVRSFITDDVRLYALRRKSFSTLLPTDGYATTTMPVTAVFRTDARTDGQNALISLRAAQKLFDYPDRATALLIRIENGRSPNAVKRAVEQAAGSGFAVTTRDEKNATMYRIMRYEKWGIFLIAAMVLVIASLSVVGLLVMIIMEKRRDITVLRAMGADNRLLRSIFTAEGLLVCGIGGAAGLAAGIAISLAQQIFGIITIPAETLLIDVYPVEVHFTDILITAAAFGVTAYLISAATVRKMITKERNI